MSADLLADFVGADRDRALGVHGSCVDREGHPPVEHRFRADDRVNVYSVAKTFTSVAVGPALGRVIARVTGADLRSFLLPRLFGPLDLHDPAWHACPLGHPFAESDLFLRTSELARFARLLAQEGRWNGRQVVPAAYVRRMTAERVDTSAVTDREPFTHGYGLGVWIDRGDTYRLDGRYGQYVVVSPARRAAVTVTAHPERDEELLAAVHELVVDRLD
ncbi:serine hydrolase [Micromonospora sp. NPDC047074]|uniref:serine hydrolase n=1 Tax=Micromonospora sp. NPDC047074 TaxID=3154339 RepID=UPI0033E3A760